MTEENIKINSELFFDKDALHCSTCGLEIKAKVGAVIYNRKWFHSFCWNDENELLCEEPKEIINNFEE
jgi:hypothetical protein